MFSQQPYRFYDHARNVLIMIEYKYIIVSTGDESEKKLAVVFDKMLAHVAMFEGLRSGQRRHESKLGSRNWTNYEIVSAGFVSYIPNKGFDRCYGYSESLDIKSNPEDIVILNGIESESMSKDSLRKRRQTAYDIINKKNPDSRHLSPKAREQKLIRYIQDNLAEDVEENDIQTYIEFIRAGKFD